MTIIVLDHNIAGSYGNFGYDIDNKFILSNGNHLTGLFISIYPWNSFQDSP